MVFVAGEAGIGKTRLAEELLLHVQRQGHVAIRARAYALEGRLAAAALEWFAVHRVIEVTSVLAVDRDECDIGEVDALALVRSTQAFRQGGGLGQRLGREAVGHFVLAHRDLDLHAGIVDLA